MPCAGAAVEAIDLKKVYGRVSAVDGISFAVPAGSVLAILGPNGAGKTTTVAMMTTLTKPTSGTARVAGFDVLTEPDKVRSSIGLTCQQSALDEVLTGRENLRIIGDLYGIRRRHLKNLSDYLLQRFSIEDAADRPVISYSGGMRRRLDLAISLLANPLVLFLDEPTAGLDPSGRIEFFGILRQLVTEGIAVVLTTQYLEEADELADNIVVIDNGRIIAEGSPRQLKERAGESSLVVTISNREDLVAAETLMRQIGCRVYADARARRLSAPSDGFSHMSRVAASLYDHGIHVEDIRLSRPSLDEVFVLLTGNHSTDKAEVKSV